MSLFDTINMWSAFAAVVINLVFVVLILARTSRTATYRLFLLTFIGVIVWNLGIFLRSFSGRGVWFYLAIIGSPMIPAFLFHLTRLLAKRSPNGVWLALAYGLAGALSLSSFLAVYSPDVKYFVDSEYWNVYFIVLLMPFVIASMVTIFQAMRAPVVGIETQQLRYVFYATIIGTGMGLTDLVQIFGVRVPKLGHAGSVVFSSIIAFGIFKYRQSYDILAQMRNKIDVLSEVAAGISHEIRNPLSSIRGAVNLLTAQAPQAKQQPAMQEYAEIIQEEIARLDSILGNFQQLTKPLSIAKETLSINEIILRTVRLAGAGVASLSISLDLASDIPPVSADASLLKQVFLNLIKNAAEACPSGGQLVISSSRGPRGVGILFRDNGLGIPSELRDSIFEPFYTTKKTGLGMGLAISRRLIEAHDGRLEAVDSGFAGAAFLITLPA